MNDIMTGIERATVVGSGVMGAGIAQTFAAAGVTVTCVDLAEDRLENAKRVILDGRFGLRRGFERGRLTEDVDTVMDRISFTTDLSEAVAGSQLVIEAIPEEIGSKVSLFRQLDAVAPGGCILASNTSGFPVAAFASATDRPELVVGWHWASPPPVMKIAEIVAHAGVSDKTLDLVTGLATACGKRPVVVRDQPRAWGFVANRVYFAMIAEARRVVDEGVVTADELDTLMVDCFGWPIGPLSMVDSAHAGWE